MILERSLCDKTEMGFLQGISHDFKLQHGVSMKTSYLGLLGCEDRFTEDQNDADKKNAAFFRRPRPINHHKEERRSCTELTVREGIYQSVLNPP